MYVDGGEWSCDCDGKADPCIHVAAAAIAAAQAAEKGEALVDAPAAKPARLVYRLSKRDRLLVITRVVIHGDGREERVSGSLASERTRGLHFPELTVTHEDLRIDRLLGIPPRDAVLGARVSDVLGALSAGAGAEVTFEGAPIKISADRVLPRASVSDAPGGGFLLRLERDPSITEVVARGRRALRGRPAPARRDVDDRRAARALAAGADVRAGRHDRAGDEGPAGARGQARRRHRDDAAPAKGGRGPARASHMDLSHQGHTLSVLPTLVYGDPPIARIDGDAIVALGNEVPVRRHDEESASCSGACATS